VLPIVADETDVEVELCLRQHLASSLPGAADDPSDHPNVLGCPCHLSEARIEIRSCGVQHGPILAVPLSYCDRRSDRRRPRMNHDPEVDAWFGDFEHPLKAAMERVREMILSDERMTETIKWKSPTFMYEGNMASLNPRTKAHVSLMFHTGASIPGDHPRLEGGGETARYMKFSDLADVEAAASELMAVVEAWCASR
jgi:hypothetical protein